MAIIRFINQINHFGITNLGDLSLTEYPLGGDYWQLTFEGDVQASDSPLVHRYFELDENSDIQPSRYIFPYDDYTNLITNLYRTKPNFMTWLSLNLFKLPYAVDVNSAFNEAFSLDSASGVQLDALGVIVGQSRKVNFTPSDGSSALLSDDNYRLLLRATIAKNLWDGKLNTLSPLWTVLFPGKKILITDRQDMTMDVTLFGEFSVVMRDLITHGYIVPKPQTVLINSVEYLSEAPAFGFDMDTEFVSGFDKGRWPDDLSSPPFFGFDQNDGYISGFDVGSWDLI